MPSIPIFFTSPSINCFIEIGVILEDKTLIPLSQTILISLFGLLWIISDNWSQEEILLLLILTILI